MREFPNVTFFVFVFSFIRNPYLPDGSDYDLPQEMLSPSDQQGRQKEKKTEGTFSSSAVSLQTPKGTTKARFLRKIGVGWKGWDRRRREGEGRKDKALEDELNCYKVGYISHPDFADTHSSRKETGRSEAALDDHTARSVVRPRSSSPTAKASPKHGAKTQPSLRGDNPAVAAAFEGRLQMKPLTPHALQAVQKKVGPRLTISDEFSYIEKKTTACFPSEIPSFQPPAPRSSDRPLPTLPQGLERTSSDTHVDERKDGCAYLPVQPQVVRHPCGHQAEQVSSRGDPLTPCADCCSLSPSAIKSLATATQLAAVREAEEGEGRTETTDAPDVYENQDLCGPQSATSAYSLQSPCRIEQSSLDQECYEKVELPWIAITELKAKLHLRKVSQKMNNNCMNAHALDCGTESVQSKSLAGTGEPAYINEHLQNRRLSAPTTEHDHQERTQHHTPSGLGTADEEFCPPYNNVPFRKVRSWPTDLDTTLSKHDVIVGLNSAEYENWDRYDDEYAYDNC
jgi:hypothetical protein